MPFFPSTKLARPTYLDALFNSQQPQFPQRAQTQSIPDTHARTPSLTRSHHSTDSFSTSRSGSAIDLHVRHAASEHRALTPALEEPDVDFDDFRSIRSLSRSLRPRLKLKTSMQSFHRRTYPSPQHRPTSSDSTSPISGGGTLHGRKSSTNLLDKRIPPVPAMPLNCHRCYYFAARNCNGWVMGGSHGDACETCSQAGFFGSP